MKKYVSISLKLVAILAIMTMFLMLSACQEEIEPEIEIGQDGITAVDEIAQLIADVTTKDGSFDNIVDRSSCTTVHFPIKGILNDEEQNFSTLDEVLNIGVQVLEIEWIYPIQVTLADHSVISLADDDALEEIQMTCLEAGSDSDIECVDFIYPFTVSVFNEKTENVDAQTLKTDKEVYNLFTTEGLVINIEYPVRLIDSEGTTIDAIDNETLIMIINETPNCDEADIIDFEEQFEQELNELLVSKTWEINSFVDAGTDKTSLFSGYTFFFNQDRTLLAAGLENFNGGWEVELLDTSRSVSMEFDTDNESFILLNENWTIVNFNQSEIYVEWESEELGTKRLLLAAK